MATTTTDAPKTATRSLLLDLYLRRPRTKATPADLTAVHRAEREWVTAGCPEPGPEYSLKSLVRVEADRRARREWGTRIQEYVRRNGARQA